MKTILKILIALVLIFAVFSAYKWYTHYQLKEDLLVYSSIDSPQATIELTELKLDSPTEAYETETVEIKDLSFEVPTKGTLSGFPAFTSFIDMVNEGHFIIGGKQIFFSEATSELLQQEEIETEYELLKFAYSQNPDGINFFSSKKILTTQYELIALKVATSITPEDTYFTYFEEGQIKGFLYCTTDTCEQTNVQLFLDNENSSIFLQFKDFTTEQVVFTLKSVKTK